ncbi:MAG: cytochrome C [Campylobacterota bacterium]|nr:cytochrome C [Campylobacterota bacterium]
MILRLAFFLTFHSLVFGDNIASLLFHGNCTMCHVETKTVSAPSIVEVKKHYKSAFAKKEDFVHYMAQWVVKPNAETSIMQHAIERHGLMPHLGYDIPTIEVIAAYMYDTDFEKPHEGHAEPKARDRHSKPAKQ